MKKSLMFVLESSLLLFLVAGCSLDDATNLGDNIMNDIDPTFLDINKNIQSFTLDSSIVDTGFSIPDADDAKFGIHSSGILPIGGRNGEIVTGYIECVTTLELWKTFKSANTPGDSIYSITIDFDTVSSNRADYNSNQKLKIIYTTDTGSKYTRKEDNISQILSSEKTCVLQPETYACDFVNRSLHNDLFRSCTTNNAQYAVRNDKSKDTLFKPDTFRFVIAAESDTANFTYLSSTPSIKVYTKYGSIHKLTENRFGALSVDSSRDTSRGIVSIWRSDTTHPLWYTPDSLFTDTVRAENFVATPSILDSINTKILKNDTLFVIDSVNKRLDSLIVNTLTVRTRDTTSDSLRISSFALIDSVRVQRNTTTIDTTTFSSKVYTLPVTYMNYINYETSDSIKTRSMRPYSSYGPQRTAVFKLSIDSLWKKLNRAPDASGYKFNELLSAGVVLSGIIDSTLSGALNYSRAREDSIIAFKWFLSDKLYSDGVSLSAHYRSWSRSDTLRSGSVAVLSIEKYLQELMSHYGTKPSEVKGPSAVFLYLDLMNNSTYRKQVIWSKPVLRTVLTNVK